MEMYIDTICSTRVLEYDVLLLFVSQTSSERQCSSLSKHMFTLTMSDIENDSQDLTYFFLYFALTCLAVFVTIFILFLCFSGKICYFIYYMVYKVQVKSLQRRFEVGSKVLRKHTATAN